MEGCHCSTYYYSCWRSSIWVDEGTIQVNLFGDDLLCSFINLATNDGILIMPWFWTTTLVYVWYEPSHAMNRVRSKTQGGFVSSCGTDPPPLRLLDNCKAHATRNFSSLSSNLSKADLYTVKFPWRATDSQFMGQNSSGWQVYCHEKLWKTP